MATLLEEEVGSPIATRDLLIDFMYLDLETCTRCRGTDASLQAALNEAGDILAAAGIRTSVRKTLIASAEQAQALGFVSSPTIRVNGRDIAFELRESPCDDCSEACACEGGVDCRVWVWQGQEHTVAPKAMIVDAILNEIHAGVAGSEQPAPVPANAAPANLARYFSGKEQAQAVTSSCCAPTEQATCCESTQKAACCGESTASGCGCR